MPSPNQLTELTVLDDEQNSSDIHFRDNRLNRFDLDDPFSVQEDLQSTAFEFDADSFLNQMRSNATTGTDDKEEEGERIEDSLGDMNDIVGVPSEYGSTDASVSTLDIYAMNEHAPAHLQHNSSPRTLSSSQSMKSEESPSTPPESIISSSQAMRLEEIVLDMSEESPDMVSKEDMESAKTEKNTLNGPHLPLESTLTVSSDVSSDAPQNGFSDGTHGEIHRQSFDSKCFQSSAPESTNPTSTTSPSQIILAQSVQSKSRSNGPSAFQKVVSKTRPPYLPPKRKEEDEKHSREWEEMMQKSRLIERKRREELQARRMARELSVEANTSLWERAILPDWKKAVRDSNLRKLWWDGIPTKLRSVVWERAVGNGLALSKDTYSSSLARARSLIAAQRFPTTALSLMELDIDTTLPQLHIFNRLTGPLHEDLYNLLCAWIICRAEEGLGYVEGTAKIGAMLLLNLTGPAQAFVVMRNLLERSCLRAFYGGTPSRDDVEAYYRIFDTLLADGMPKVYFNFKQHQISPAEYLIDWILPLFLNHLPLEACSRIWDVFLLEGDAFLFRVALALLASIESRLFFPDRKELLDVLKGESRAALEVARREVPSLFGSQDEMVGPKYEIYNLNEETIWERLTEMADWWKESTWQRLIVRELPDL